MPALTVTSYEAIGLLWLVSLRLFPPNQEAGGGTQATFRQLQVGLMEMMLKEMMPCISSLCASMEATAAWFNRIKYQERQHLGCTTQISPRALKATVLYCKITKEITYIEHCTIFHIKCKSRGSQPYGLPPNNTDPVKI